jgi:hypothetical protein
MVTETKRTKSKANKRGRATLIVVKNSPETEKKTEITQPDLSGHLSENPKAGVFHIDGVLMSEKSTIDDKNPLETSVKLEHGHDDESFNIKDVLNPEFDYSFLTKIEQTELEKELTRIHFICLRGKEAYAEGKTTIIDVDNFDIDKFLS